MKKLTIVFDDGSKVIYTMKNSVSWLPYFVRHSTLGMRSAVVQQYPLKHNKPLILVDKTKAS